MKIKKSTTTFFLSLVLSIISYSLFAGDTNDAFKEKARTWMENSENGFLENKGQLKYDDGRIDTNTLYTLSTADLEVFITKQGIKYVFLEIEREHEEPGKESFIEELKKKVKWSRIDMTLEGASIKKENIVNEFPSFTSYNYFFAHCPDGIYGVKLYNKITISNIYPGIDWVLYTSENKNGLSGFKYDFVVHPGADPALIKMSYKGPGKLILDSNNDLTLKTKRGKLTEQKPFTYQNKNTISSSFLLSENKVVSFNLGEYDKNSTLVIDPQLKWATLYGGAMHDGPMAICTDLNGNIFITGYASPNIPMVNPGGGAYFQTASGAWGSAMICKFNANGSLFWATYYGGTTPSSMMLAEGTGVVCDPTNGDLYVVGNTTDTVLPLQNPGGGAYFQSVFGGPINNFGVACEGFIAKFNNNGVRSWATFYGGSGYDNPHNVATDPAGNLYITGQTASPNFPCLNPGSGAYFQSAIAGGDDVFILKFNSLGVRQWATLYGGSGTDEGRGIGVNPAGELYVTGTTLSANFPLMNMGGAYNQTVFASGRAAFLLKFNGSCVQQWGTLFGNGPYGNGLAIDQNANVYLVGKAYATAAIPVQNLPGAYNQATCSTAPDAFVAKFNSAGALTWATFLGGNGAEHMDSQLGSSNAYQQVSVDCKNNLYVTGVTTSSNFPTVNPGCSEYFDNTFGGGGWFDLFFTKFNSLGAMQWSTYYGQNQYEFSRASCVDRNGSLFITGEYVAQGNSGPALFPLMNPGGGAYYQSNNVDGFDDGVIIKLSPAPLTLTTSTTPTNCGGNTGTATVNIACGLAPYTYLWNPTAQTTATATGLAAGNYTVIVNSAGKCTPDTAYATVINTGGSITVTSTGVQPSCSSSNGSITANPSGGSSPYTYLWSNTQTNQTATGLGAGSYTVVVTDLNGCTQSLIVVLTANGGPTASASVNTNVSCNAGSNGSATASATGGTSPYTYLWSNGQTNANATGLTSGTYTVTVTDANGCTSQQTVIITQPTILSATISNTSINCNGGTNATATATPSGGTSGYTYLWSNTQTNQTATGLGAGTYTVTVTDANGCTTQQTVTLTQPTPILASASSTNTNCGNSTGTAIASASGGTGPYTYSWNNSQTTITATGLGAATYTVYVTDANGCTQTATVTVGNTNGPTASTIINAQVLCNGGNNGNATASATGGTSPYTYLWSNSQTNANATGLIAGTYTVTVTDANGCTSTQTISITEPTLLISTPASTNVNCNGGNNATATVTPSGGTSPYTYVWSNSQTNQTASNLIAGTYTCTVTDANGCTSQQIITITQPTAITASTSTTTSSCGNSTGTATASASGGTGPYTYSWSNSQTTITATGLGAGIYTVYVTDANGCTQTATATINNSNGPTASVSLTTSILCNGGTNASATGSATGGTSPYTYSWNNAQTTATATGLPAGTYTVTVTDANGCTSQQTITITEPSVITVINTSTPDTCLQTNGTASATASGGTGPYTYLWNTSSTSQSISNLSSGTYTVTITDANGCTQIQTVIVGNVGGAIANAGIDVAITQGSSTTLNGSGGVSYSWYPSATLSCSTCQNPSATPSSTTTYYVVVTNANGCTGIDSVTVFVDTPCNGTLLSTLMPNAFTPNNDGRNDDLCVPANVCIINFLLTVYDRWGEKVFETDDVNRCWDGTYKSKELNTAVFVYYLDAELSNGEKMKFQGNISLIK